MVTSDATTATDLNGKNRVSVLLPLPLDGAYDYAADDDLALEVGNFVAVPLGSREVVGVVWGDATGDVDEAKIKPVAARFDAPPMPDSLRKFVEWVAAYSLSPPGAVLRMAMNVRGALEPPKLVRAYAAAEIPPDLRLTPTRKRVLEILAEGPPRTASDLAREAGVGTSVVKGLAKAGAVTALDLPPGPAYEPPDPDHPGTQLSDEQQAAASSLCDQVDAESFAVTLLDGVTGAGPAARPSGAGAVARNRADAAMVRSLRAAFRYRTRRLAFRFRAIAAEAGVARGGDRRGAGRRRRPLGAVPAVRRVGAGDCR